MYCEIRALLVAQSVKKPPEMQDSACNTGIPGSVPMLGSSPGKRNCSPLQHSCLENSMDRRAWWAIVHGVTKSLTQLSD